MLCFNTRRGLRRRWLIALIGYLLFISILVMATSWYFERRAEHILTEQGERASVAWATFLGNGLIRLEEITQGAAITEVEEQFFRAALMIQDIYRFKLYTVDGYVIFDSKGTATDKDLARDRHSDRARQAAQTLQSIAELKSGTGDAPALYVETYTPILFNGQAVGVAEVYMNQTESATRVRRNILNLGFIAGLSMAIALVLPGIGLVILLRRLDRQNADLVLQRNRVDQAERIKGEFLARMSHDLRTPLNSIIGFSDIIRSGIFGTQNPDRTMEYARLIHRSGLMMLGLVNDILDLSVIEARTTPRQPVRIDLPTMVQEVVEGIQTLASEKSIEIHTKLPDPCPNPMMDEQSFTRILTNLLSNAVKYTKPGGRIDIVAWQDADRASIRITDTGIGIPEEELSLILEPFTQVETDPHISRQGVGLGLCIVKALLDEVGGTLKIDSVYGKGTSVTFTLAAAPVDRTVPDDDGITAAKDAS